MHADSSAPCASARGIPASTLLSALDHDMAYNFLDACTVQRVPLAIYWAGETQLDTDGWRAGAGGIRYLELLA